MRYTYMVAMGDFVCKFNSVDEVVDAVNIRAGVPILTKDMIYTLFTRPEKRNKRMFEDGKLRITRQRVPTKTEMAQEQLDEIKAMAASLVST